MNSKIARLTALSTICLCLTAGLPGPCDNVDDAPTQVLDRMRAQMNPQAMAKQVLSATPGMQAFSMASPRATQTDTFGTMPEMNSPTMSAPSPQEACNTLKQNVSINVDTQVCVAAANELISSITQIGSRPESMIEPICKFNHTLGLAKDLRVCQEEMTKMMALVSSPMAMFGDPQKLMDQMCESAVKMGMSPNKEDCVAQSTKQLSQAMPAPMSDASSTGTATWSYTGPRDPDALCAKLQREFASNVNFRSEQCSEAAQKFLAAVPSGNVPFSTSVFNLQCNLNKGTGLVTDVDVCVEGMAELRRITTTTNAPASPEAAAQLLCPAVVKLASTAAWMPA